MTDYRKMYRTKSKEAIARIKLLESQNAKLAADMKFDVTDSEEYRKLKAENAVVLLREIKIEKERDDLAKEASSLAIKNIELEKQKAILNETIRQLDRASKQSNEYNTGAITALNNVIVRLFEEKD